MAHNNFPPAKDIKKYDRSGILRFIDSFPRQCRAGIEIGKNISTGRKYRGRYPAIVCAGMGGSAIGADIARSYLAYESGAVITVNRSYGLPAYAGRESLVIASSYSGNTEETISAYTQALSRGCDIVVISSGGRLKAMALDDGNAHVDIPGGMPPRCALGYSFFPLLALLTKFGAAKDHSAGAMKAAGMLEKEKERIKRTAAKIARELHGRLPVIYSSQDRIDCVATRWRGQLAENSKTLCSSNVLPEMNHNEITGWEHPSGVIKRCAVVMLKDKGDDPRIAKRMEITSKIVSKERAKVVSVTSKGAGLLERIFYLIYTGDFVSFYLAILNRVDPASIDRIDYLKRRLAGL